MCAYRPGYCGVDDSDMAPSAAKSDLPYLTTYSHVYNRTDAVSLPPILYRDLPSLVRGGTRPDADRVVPSGPRRRLTRERPICVGLGTTDLGTHRYLDSKPIVNSIPPHKVVSVLPNIVQSSNILSDIEESSDVLNCLNTDSQWTTTYKQAGQGSSIAQPQGCPPTTTFEEHADWVKYRPYRHEIKCINWQNLTGIWDPKQLRRRTGETETPDRCHGGGNDHAKDQSRLPPCPGDAGPRIRPCPGYSGYVPRETAQVKVDVIHDPESPFATSMRTTYRKPPTVAFRTSRFAHRGPLCRTVTLTYPFNPFNKTE
ncbi:uncharacterized protein [Branchiostoma lanceolatum]|uniref:uncharacterized protein n=1 Tax=Branchiostoma lanceolatum TaxID=7740 RepID=UPI003455BA4E